jgi:cephalosporin hydroxylase
MKVSIDTKARTFERDGERFDLYGKEAFEALSDLWIRLGWNQKYTYTFTWLGVPIIQLPEDMIRYQEVVTRLQPDVIVETGVAHGGSAVFSASLCRLMGRGRVIAVDIDIREHNRRRLDAHPLRDLITLVEGSSTSASVLATVRAAIRPGESVLVVLDSNHSKAHVAAEFEAYAALVSPGSYIVATDGLMRDLTDVPRGEATWASDNPAEAALEFASRHPQFVIEQPLWPFNESALTRNVTHWPHAWLKRIS